MASLKPKSNFNPEEACESLRAAMKGAGTDEQEIIVILTSHSNEQRQEIKDTFKTMYGMDLEEEIKSEISGEFENVGVGLLYAPSDYLACQLRKAMDGAGTTEGALIEILCTRSNDEIDSIKQAYTRIFDRDLEEDIHSETSDDFRRLLISQVNASRDESTKVDRDQAQEDAQAIWDAGEAELGTDESTFNMILCQRSFPQLRHTFEVYQDLTGKDIEDSIRAEMSKDLEDGLLAVVKSIKNLPRYYAEQLHKSMSGAGTDDDALIRLVISRAEIDMEHIKKEFSALYEDSLANWIKDDTRGDYEKVLIHLIGEDE